MGIRLNGSQLLCESLVREGVVDIFGLPGGAILPLYQTLPEFPQLRHILTRHEQGAAHAADGYARVTGKVGVCWATSGPGATNLVTGIATAQMDSIPIVAVVGQVARAAIGTDAFQETDTTGITLPITKHNTLVMDPAEIPQVVKEAFHIAGTGRPGPVVIDVPKDVQIEEVELPYDTFDEYYKALEIDLPGYKPNLKGHNSQIKKAVKLIDEAEQPVILAGHGIIFSGAYAELRELAEKAQIPVITTLLGISSFPDDHILCVGMPGMHGMAYASIAIEEADLLIALGMRFDDRITGKPSAFALKSKKIHIDIDPSEIGKNIEVDVPIVGDLKRVLTKLNPQVRENTHTDWLRRIEELKAEHPSHVIRDAEQLLPQLIIRELSEVTNGDAVIVTGVGQHQMWAAQHFTYKYPCTFITSGGSGAMGYEVPGAMGVQVGVPGKVVWSVAGDGGFQMTMCELATIVENRLPVKFAIINNNVLGMVHQWQEFFYDKSYVATAYTANPDIRELSEVTNGDAVIVTGVGQHQMWAAQHFTYKYPCTFITSGGSGAMGYEVPGAMGVQVGVPGKAVWSVAGDGGFQMTMCELATIVENRLPVKFAIINNNVLGMVHQWQEFFYDKTYVATAYTANPDFVKLAEAFGIKGMRVTDKVQVRGAIEEAMAHDGPVIIDFIVEEEERVYPMIKAGGTIEDLVEEPVFTPQEVAR